MPRRQKHRQWRSSAQGTGGQRRDWEPRILETTKELFVSGLSSSMTAEALRDEFESFGKIETCFIVKGKTYGFITFSDASTAQQLPIHQRRFCLSDNSKIFVTPAMPLHDACEANNLVYLRKCLTDWRRLDVSKLERSTSARYLPRKTALTIAVEHNRVDASSLLLRKNLDIACFLKRHLDHGDSTVEGLVLNRGFINVQEVMKKLVAQVNQAALIAACESGDLQCSKLLSQNTSKSVITRNILRLACKRKLDDALDILLSSSTVDHDAKAQLLVYACTQYEVCLPVMVTLIEKHATDLNSIAANDDMHFTTPLQSLIARRVPFSELDYDIMRYFIRLGADVNLLTPSGSTALSVACAVNDIRTVRWLMDRGACFFDDMLLRCIHRMRLPVIKMTRDDIAAVAKYCLENGLVSAEEIASCALSSCSHGHFGLVRLFIDFGAEVAPRDLLLKCMHALFDYASVIDLNGLDDFLAILMFCRQHGINLSLSEGGDDGYNLLVDAFSATFKDAHRDEIKTLNFMPFRDAFRDAFHQTIVNNYMLVESRNDDKANPTGSRRFTAELSSVLQRWKCLQFLRALVETLVFDPNVMIDDFDDFENRTLLYFVCGLSEGILPYVTDILLATSSLEIDKPSTENEETPLHIACRRGNFNLAKQLLDAGANSHAITRDFQTPLFIAAHNEHWNIVELLAMRAPSNWFYPSCKALLCYDVFFPQILHLENALVTRDSEYAIVLL